MPRPRPKQNKANLKRRIARQLVNPWLTTILSYFTDEQILAFIKDQRSVTQFLNEDPRRVQAIREIVLKFPDESIQEFADAMRDRNMLLWYLQDPDGLSSVRPRLRNIFLYYNGGFEWLHKQLRDLSQHPVLQLEPVEATPSPEQEMEQVFATKTSQSRESQPFNP